MNRFAHNITNLRDYNLQHTQLSQMCGSKLLFRGCYQILRVLGRGGFGITFLAQNMVLPGQPLCVIKQLCPKITNDKVWRRACQRFEIEAKTLAQLGSHAQIPMLIDYFEGNGELYLVQEYVPGHTLAREVRKNGVKTELEVKNFLREVLPVLNYLHQQQVIHRDIKPQNLLRCEDDQRIVLIDFGAVKEKLVQNSSHSSHIASTNFIGTMGFAPPEQLSLRPVYASDIYALGITCIYLLTGRGPLDFDYNLNTGELFWQQSVRVSSDFARILDKMVKASLHERFKSAHEVMVALDWENSWYKLNSCLTNQPCSHTNAQVQETSSEYMSPATRTALAIRSRRTRHNKYRSFSNFHPL
jgi:serine/threonine protein kinase